ncbi:MAG: DUF2007 domain-containing protein [Bacteroidetes bacterium]|nr:DUF2007 domain-containing protein [Bacteroidota bacterium]
MAEEFVTLTTYTYTTEAYILVAKLEAEGIRSFLKNEHLVSTQHMLSNAVGGIDVQVNPNDLQRGKEIFEKMEQEKKDSEKLPEDLPADFEKIPVYCPECESSNVYRKKSILFSLFDKPHICTDCGNKWKQ